MSVCPDITSVELVLQGAMQPVASFELRAAVDVYFRRRPGMWAAGKVYVWAIIGSMRVLLASADLPVGDIDTTDANGKRLLSLRNIMAERVDVTTDGSSYVGDGSGRPLDAYGSFAIVAWGQEPTADAQPAFPTAMTVTSTATPSTPANALLTQTIKPWAVSGVAVAGPALLYQLFVTSKSASSAWMLVYDAYGAPADGGAAAGAPLLLAIPIPANSGTSIDFSQFGLKFALGIAYVMSSAATPQTTLAAADFRTLWQYSV